MSSSLLLQQCPACLVHLTGIVFVMGGRWLYSWCLVGCCLFAKPRKLFRGLTFSGAGMSFIALARVRSGLLTFYELFVPDI